MPLPRLFSPASADWRWGGRHTADRRSHATGTEKARVAIKGTMFSRVTIQAVDDACDGGRRQNDQRQQHPVHAGIFQTPCDEHAAEGRHGASGQVAAAGHDQEGHADGGQSDQRGGNQNVDEVSVCKVVGVQRRENRGHQNQCNQKHQRVAGNRQLEAFLLQGLPLCGIVCHIMPPPS